MPVSGHQDFWVVGARAYFKKTGGAERDLGIIQTVTPNLTTESIEIEDPDGGVKTTADKQITKITENYDLTLSNINLRNLSLMFLANDPTDLSVTAEEKTFTSSDTFDGELHSIRDTNGEPVRMTEIAGVFTGGIQRLTDDITAITASTRTITVTTDPNTWTAGAPSAGDQIIVHPEGLADKANAGTYTIASFTTSTIVVEEEFAGDETAVTVDLTVEDGGTIYDFGTDWSIVNEDRGLWRFIEGGAFTTDGTTVSVVYWQYAITGERSTVPQANSTIEGELRIIFSRDTFGSETERYIPKVKVTPGSTNFQVDDYSNFVLNFEVVSDDSVTNTVGHLKHYKGTVPSKS